MKFLFIISLFAIIFYAIGNAQNLDTTRILDSCYIKKDKVLWLGAVSEHKIQQQTSEAYFSSLQLLKGKIPGLSVMQTMGNDPSQQLQVQLRGTSSLYLKTDMLYVVDGAPVENINMVMPSDIESISILRSVSETASYGTRGVNGVILINTKRGCPNKKLKVSYSTFFYLESQSKESDFLNASEWREVKKDWNPAMFSLRDFPIKDASHLINFYSNLSESMIDLGANTDWMKEISQNKISQSHNLAFSGTLHKTSYYFSLNYQHLNGFFINNKNNTFNENLRITKLALKDKLEITLNLRNANSNFSQYNTNPYIIQIFSRTERYNPTIPIDYFDEGSPVLRLNKTSDNRTANNFLTHENISYKINKNLKVHIGFIHQEVFNKDVYAINFIPIPYETILKESQKDNSFNTGMDFKKIFGKNEVNFSLGYLDRNSKVSSKEEKKSGGWMLSGISKELHTGYFTSSLNYNYAQRYYVKAHLTRETFYSSGKDTSVYLPSLAIGWKLNNEKFLEDLTWLNNLTLRASYGKSSRPPIRNKKFEDEDLDMHFENVEEINAGIDLEILERFSLSWDYFKRDIRDGVGHYLYFITGAPSIGTPHLQNKGWELNMSAMPVLSSNVQWSVKLNYSKIERTISSLKHPLYYFNVDKFGNSYSVDLKNNDKIGAIYATKFVGFTDDGKGLVDFKTTGTKTQVGNTLPLSYLGITNILVYKNFDLTISLRGAFEFDIINTSYFSNSLNLYTRTSPNYSARIVNEDPRAVYLSSDILHTDYVIEKGDFVKIDNITFGYNLNVRKLKINNIRLYLACNNVATFTEFKGLDPEMACGDWSSAGNYQNNPYFATRMFMIGCQINFL